jgi:hypothetical protein
MVHQVLGHNHNTPGPVILLKNFHHVLLTICKFQRIISWVGCVVTLFSFVVVARARLKKSSVQIFLSPHCKISVLRLYLLVQLAVHTEYTVDTLVCRVSVFTFLVSYVTSELPCA